MFRMFNQSRTKPTIPKQKNRPNTTIKINRPIKSILNHPFKGELMTCLSTTKTV